MGNIKICLIKTYVKEPVHMKQATPMILAMLLFSAFLGISTAADDSTTTRAVFYVK